MEVCIPKVDEYVKLTVDEEASRMEKVAGSDLVTSPRRCEAPINVMINVVDGLALFGR
jgi:hypothetical protein